MITVVSEGRNEEASTILAQLHSTSADTENLFAREEFFQITSQYNADKQAYGDVGYLDLFTKPHLRKRTLIGTLVMWASQANGAIVIYSKCLVLEMQAAMC